MTTTTKQNQRAIEPTHVEEAWTIIHLPNGDKLKAKHVVMGVMEMLDDDGKPTYNEDGSKICGIIFSQPIVGYIFKDDKQVRKVN